MLDLVGTPLEALLPVNPDMEGLGGFGVDSEEAVVVLQGNDGY